MNKDHIIVRIQRYQPEKSLQPYDQTFEVSLNDIEPGMMLLKLLQNLRDQDPTLTFRSSCQEGVCGSDGMNVNGKNHLSCITPVADLGSDIVIRPLPGFPIVKDLIVDMTLFYEKYESVQPYLQTEESTLETEHSQTPEQRAQLDGHYECILCACCSSSCPSFWWNPDLFPGPAALLASHRFVIDSRDIMPIERLKAHDSAENVFRCRHIQNCTDACPKGLNPSRAIQDLKRMIVEKT